MRNAGRLVLGFYPLPTQEATRLRGYLRFPESDFAAVDPCVGNGVALETLLQDTRCHRYGIELDALRAEEAASRNIEVIHGDALEVHCVAESISLLYLNPPYDFEVGSFENRRFEELFLRHTYRWLRRNGVLVFVIPRRQLTRCSPLLAEYFTSIRVYRLTSPESVQYNQIAILASRRNTRQTQNDNQHRAVVRYLEKVAGSETEIPDLADVADVQYEVPPSGAATLTYRGTPLDTLEDVLPVSSAYHQASRLLLRQPTPLRGRPITQLHGGHVALLAASGALNGVFGEGHDRHMANWSPSRMFHHSKVKEDDGSTVSRKWTSFSPKLLLLYQDGRTEVLTHRKLKPEADDDGQHELPIAETAPAAQSSPSTKSAPKTRKAVRRHITLPKT